jgi:hypothetical protein
VVLPAGHIGGEGPYIAETIKVAIESDYVVVDL